MIAQFAGRWSTTIIPPHLLTHSNWEWAKRCQSESFLSLVGGLQAALGRLGKKPRHLGTDNSNAATHEIGSGRRAFNPDYLDLCEHYGFSPITINIRESA